METKRKPIDERERESKAFWSNDRRSYAIGLAISCFSAFVLYSLLGSVLVKEFEVSIFTTFGQGVGCLIMIGITTAL